MCALDFSFHFVYLWFSVQLHGAAANENVTRRALCTYRFLMTASHLLFLASLQDL